MAREGLPMHSVKASRMLVVGALAFSGCVPLGRGRTYSSQVVVAKTTDGYLVAAGGDKCRVTSGALAAARVGSSVRCLWMRPTSEPRLGRPAPPRVVHPAHDRAVPTFKR